MPSKSLFPQSCESFGGSMVGLMATPSKRAYYNQVCCTQSPCPCGRPLLTHTSTGDTQTLKGRSGSVSVGSPGMHKVLFEPSEHLCWLLSLILNMISPLLPSCWVFSFALKVAPTPYSCHPSTVRMLLQRLPSCWGFSALGRGISPHSSHQKE